MRWKKSYPNEFYDLFFYYDRNYTYKCDIFLFCAFIFTKSNKVRIIFCVMFSFYFIRIEFLKIDFYVVEECIGELPFMIFFASIWFSFKKFIRKSTVSDREGEFY